jgi:hypothetical protein
MLFSVVEQLTTDFICNQIFTIYSLVLLSTCQTYILVIQSLCPSQLNSHIILSNIYPGTNLLPVLNTTIHPLVKQVLRLYPLLQGHPLSTCKTRLSSYNPLNVFGAIRKSNSQASCTRCTRHQVSKATLYPTSFLVSER